MAAKKTFEENMSRLEEIVSLLERGDATLGDSMALFEEGTKRLPQGAGHRRAEGGQAVQGPR
mgnify:CR=1 FL=1